MADDIGVAELRNPAFQKFLQLVRDPGVFEVWVGGHQIRVNGVVLIL
jgi:hypothetical protein